MIIIPYITMLLVKATRGKDEDLFEGLAEGLERMKNILEKLQKENENKGKPELAITLKSKPNVPKTTACFHFNVDYLKVRAGGDAIGDFSGITYESRNEQDNNGIKEGESKERTAEKTNENENIVSPEESVEELSFESSNQKPTEEPTTQVIPCSSNCSVNQKAPEEKEQPKLNSDGVLKPGEVVNHNIVGELSQHQ